MALFHFTIHTNENSEAVIREIRTLKKQIMAQLEEFQQALADVTTALENIANDITRLTDQLGSGNLTDEQEQDVLNQLRGIADRARAIADQTPETETPSPDTE